MVVLVVAVVEGREDPPFDDGGNDDWSRTGTPLLLLLTVVVVLPEDNSVFPCVWLSFFEVSDVERIALDIRLFAGTLFDILFVSDGIPSLLKEMPKFKLSILLTIFSIYIRGNK
jgi:hypothetical protein